MGSVIHSREPKIRRDCTIFGFSHQLVIRLGRYRLVVEFWKNEA